MALILFTFAFNSETQAADFSGNVEPEVALQILTKIAISNAVKMALDAKKEDKTEGDEQ